MIRLMHGFPPSTDRQVTLANWRQAPFSRWAFHHVRELVPSAEIVNDPADVHEWRIDRVEIGNIPIEAEGARPLSFDEFLVDTDRPLDRNAEGRLGSDPATRLVLSQS
jgi:hypothetical protein